LAVPATAAAAHWPAFGGDAGRSGNQPVSAGTPPVRALYSSAEAGDQNVRTSILATGGAVGVQRFAYGTPDHVHLRVLQSGAPVGPASGVDVDDGAADADTFGPGPGAPAPASVGLVDSSTPGGLGQLFAVHNDDDEGTGGDISIAQIDEATGGIVKQVQLTGSEGFSIRSSPALSEPDALGARALFFVAEKDDDERLFRVAVADAGSTSASFGAVTSTPDIDANPEASPTIIWLRDASGRPKSFVALGSGAPDSAVKTFAASDLAAGPASGDLGDDVQTVTAPVQPDGSTPSPAGAVKTAPVLYVAARAGTGTVVHRLVQNGNAQALATAASSPALPGAPAPALATDVEARAAGPTAGRVVATTGENLYLLDGASLAQAAAFSPGPLSPGATGFGKTTAAVARGFAYVTSDDGRQVVLKLDDAQPVAAADFAENPVNAGSRPANSAFGQPALSRSFVIFGSQKGVFVYVTRCGNPVSGTEGADRIIGTAAGAHVTALGGNDRVSAAGSDDCVFGGAGDDAVSGNSGDDEVSGGDGGDRAYGRTGADAVSGDAGDDVVAGGPGDDQVHGGADRDVVSGNAGADTVRGLSGDDRVVGRGDADALSGNSGNDRVSGGSGNDRVFGRSGDDGASGNAGDDRVSAGSGDDRVFGRTGNDGVSGNAGDDRVDGGSGNDRLFGRRGDDFLDARDGERDLVYCGSGHDTVRADRADLLRGCERRFRR
jgi:Ca2+-binding RTX toxin-like protein